MPVSVVAFTVLFAAAGIGAYRELHGIDGTYTRGRAACSPETLTGGGVSRCQVILLRSAETGPGDA